MLSERLVGRARILLKKVDSSPIGGCPLRGRRLVTASTQFLTGNIKVQVNLLHQPTSVNFHQDIILHIPVVRQ